MLVSPHARAQLGEHDLQFSDPSDDHERRRDDREHDADGGCEEFDVHTLGM